MHSRYGCAGPTTPMCAHQQSMQRCGCGALLLKPLEKLETAECARDASVLRNSLAQIVPVVRNSVRKSASASGGRPKKA